MPRGWLSGAQRSVGLVSAAERVRESSRLDLVRSLFLASALATLHECLYVVTLLMAPFTPFVTERVWQDLFASTSDELPDSVHLAAWPVVDDSLVDEREIVHPITHAGFRLPRGWLLRICVHESHRDPAVFEHPEVFDPDRFLRRAPTRDRRPNEERPPCRRPPRSARSGTRAR